MNKAEFLHEIEKRIAALSEDERRTSLDFFSEMLDERMEEGMSEEEAVVSIGSVEEIAANILQEAPVATVRAESAVHCLNVTQEFSRVNITDINRDITLYVSRDNSCCVEYKDIAGMNTELFVRDGCLHIETKDERRWFDRLKSVLKSDGDLTVALPDKIYDELRVRCVSGDLKFKGVMGGNFHTGTANGDISFENIVAKEIHASTTNGDVKISGDPKVLHISTVNGDITGHLKTGKVFHTSTVVGDIKVPASDPDRGGAHLSTVTGDIKIKVK